MALIKQIALHTKVTISDTVLKVAVFAEPAAEGGIRANVLTRSATSRGPEVWLDAPEMRELRDLLTEVLGD